MHANVQRIESGSSPKLRTTPEPDTRGTGVKQTQYTCSMHPQIVRDQRERYAKPILWLAVYRIILRAWDNTRKRIWLGGVVLYRSS